MDKLIKVYRETLPIIILLFYSIGYIFLSNYYSRFGIDIEYYLSFADLFFFSIELLLTNLLIAIIIEFFLLGISILFLKNNDDNNLIRDENELIRLLYISIFILIIVFFFNVFTRLADNIAAISILLIIIKFIMINRISFNSKVKRNKKKLLNLLVFLAIVAVLILFSFFYSLEEVEKVRENKKGIFSKEIEFYFDEKLYSTEKNECLTYIGETSSNIFLFNKDDKKALVFFKNQLVNIKIKSPHYLTKKEIQEIKDFEEEFELLHNDEE